MQKFMRFILKRKNQITFFSGALIITAFVSKFGFKNEDIFMWTLIVASVLGAVPIAIQAYQALRVMVEHRFAGNGGSVGSIFHKEL